MIRDAISEKEYYMMEHYITYNSNATGNTSAYDLLSIWAKQKEMLYELLGNKLIYSKSICYKRGWDELEDTIFKFLLDEYHHWRFTQHSKYFAYSSDKIIIFKFMDEVDKLIDKKAIYVNELVNKTYTSTIFTAYNIGYNTYNNATFKLPTDDSHFIYCEEGTKLSKMLGKIARKFNIPGYEEYRIFTSQLTNQNNLTGDLCISIHPLDYFTMSDNNCDWDSCMKWQNALDDSGGEYCRGTISMMNSPVVVVAYLKSKDDMMLECCDDDPAYTWNNKKWRQLFVVSQHAIASVKAYPYENASLTNEIISILRQLAVDTFGWTYDEEKSDYMKSQGWEGFNIRFTTYGHSMYCDFGYESTHHILVNTNLGKLVHINYGGQDICLECGRPLSNDSFEDDSKLICKECYPYHKCNSCGEEYHKDDMIYADGVYYCRSCYEYDFSTCNICNTNYNNTDEYCEGEIVVVDDEGESVYGADNFYCCPDCRHRINSYSDGAYLPFPYRKYFTGNAKITLAGTVSYNRHYTINIAGLTPEGLRDLCHYEPEDTEENTEE